MCSMTRLATTTETGESIAVPLICLYIVSLNEKYVTFRHRDSRLRMLLTVRKMRSDIVSSCSKHTFKISRAKLVGTQVNNEITSNDTNTSSMSNVSCCMKWANSFEFHTAYGEFSTKGERRDARYFERLYVGEK